MTKCILVSNAGISLLPEIDKKFWLKAIGQIGGANQKLQAEEFEIIKDSKLAQNLIFDQLSTLVNFSMISKDIDALVNYKGTNKGFKYLIND